MAHEMMSDNGFFCKIHKANTIGNSPEVKSEELDFYQIWQDFYMDLR